MALMSRVSFDLQIDRLRNNWPKDKWTNERVRFIWDVVKFQPIEWLDSTVTFFLGTFKQVPQIKDFKERLPRKTTQPEYVKEMQSIFSLEEKAEMWATIKEIASGRVSKENARLFQDTVQAALDVHYKYKCHQCMDKGFLIAINEEQHEFVFKCSCEQGQRRLEIWPTWSGWDRSMSLKDYQI